MPETRHQKKQKLLNVAQKIEVEKVEKQLSKARWGIPSRIVDHPRCRTIKYYFEIFLSPTERQTRKQEPEEYNRITSLIRGLKSDKSAVQNYIQNLIKQEQYSELEIFLKSVYTWQHEEGHPYPFANIGRKNKNKNKKKETETATDSDVEEITAEKLAAKPAEKLIWNFPVKDQEWSHEGILGYADGKQGVTRVKEEREREID